jgi:hypothetical protein
MLMLLKYVRVIERESTKAAPEYLARKGYIKARIMTTKKRSREVFTKRPPGIVSESKSTVNSLWLVAFCP